MCLLLHSPPFCRRNKEPAAQTRGIEKGVRKGVWSLVANAQSATSLAKDSHAAKARAPYAKESGSCENAQ
jgi:hypothetical protein